MKAGDIMGKKTAFCLLLFTALLCCACGALAGEISVSPHGGADFASLGEAVAAAQAGDV